MDAESGVGDGSDDDWTAAGFDLVTRGVKGIEVNLRPLASNCWSAGVGMGVFDPNFTSVDREGVMAALRMSMLLLLCSSMLR